MKGELVSLFEQFFALVEATFAFLRVRSDELLSRMCTITGHASIRSPRDS